MPEQLITTDDKPTIELKLTKTSGDDDQLRAQAVKQVERVRAFKLHLAASFLGMLLLTAIWAISEYHNAGGWAHSFSQSSGTPHVWNDWIIWPWMVWVFVMAVRAYAVFMRRPASETEIQREMDRIRRAH